MSHHNELLDIYEGNDDCINALGALSALFAGYDDDGLKIKQLYVLVDPIINVLSHHNARLQEIAQAVGKQNRPQNRRC